MLDVVINQSGVSGWGVETFPQVLKEDPHKHGANRQPHYGQADSRVYFVDRSACVI